MDFGAARDAMVRTQLAARGIQSARVLDAFRRVPRERFVPPAWRARAFDDCALPLAVGQTISQPFIVARMVEALGPRPTDTVLEVGTGSGYAAAILAELAERVVTVERLDDLARSARRRLARLGYARVRVEQGDGSRGWPPDAPYDAILVSAAAPGVPPSLRRQLAPGGRLVLPVGSRSGDQRLERWTHGFDGVWTRDRLEGVRFVPLVGDEGWPDGEPCF